MFYSSQFGFSSPSGYSGYINRSKSCSLNRYSSPARYRHVSPSRAIAPPTSYRVPVLRETPDSINSTHMNYLSVTTSSSRSSSFSREPQPDSTDPLHNGRWDSLSSLNSSRRSSFAREPIPETEEILHSGRWDSLSSLSTARRSSFTRNSQPPAQKHVQFIEGEKRADATASWMKYKRGLNLEPMQRMNKKTDSDVRMKLSTIDMHPTQWTSRRK